MQDQLRSAKSQLEKLSVTDGLTGLYNHRHFEDRLHEEFRRSHRYSDPLALVMLDLDHFKDINDRFGHPFGDRCSARRRSSSARASATQTSPRDTAERSSRIILPKAHLQGALTVAERIHREHCGSTLMRPTPTRAAARPAEVRVTASLGIAFYPSKDVTSPETLVEIRRRGAVPREA